MATVEGIRAPRFVLNRTWLIQGHLLYLLPCFFLMVFFSCFASINCISSGGGFSSCLAVVVMGESGSVRASLTPHGVARAQAIVSLESWLALTRGDESSWQLIGLANMYESWSPKVSLVEHVGKKPFRCKAEVVLVDEFRDAKDREACVCSNM